MLTPVKLNLQKFSHQKQACCCVLSNISDLFMTSLLGSQWYIHAGWCICLMKANGSSKQNRKEHCNAMIENVFSKPWMQSHQMYSMWLIHPPSEGGDCLCISHCREKKFLFLLSPCAMPWFDARLVLVWNGHTQIKLPPVTQLQRNHAGELC